MKDGLSHFLPLSAATLHILMALAPGDLHGYGIMQAVEIESEGRYKLGPGTLYDNLAKLMEQRLVLDTGGRAGDDDRRRRYYRLSALGRGVLTAEIDRLERLIRAVRGRVPRRA